MKQIILLFGEMGGGKTHNGLKLVQFDPTLIFLEGDSLIPWEMAALVDKFKPIPERLILKLVDHLKEVPLWHGLKEFDGIVISQALYRDAHRKALIEHWQKQGYDVVAVWIKVGFWQNLKQLWRRPRGLRWVLYWLMSKPFFQKPTHAHVVGLSELFIDWEAHEGPDRSAANLPEVHSGGEPHHV